MIISLLFNNKLNRLFLIKMRTNIIILHTYNILQTETTYLTDIWLVCYYLQDAILSNIFLRELMNRINGKTFSENDGVSYLDFTDTLPMDGRALSREMEEEQIFPVDYDSLSSLNIRDQEYLQHSSLWQKQVQFLISLLWQFEYFYFPSSIF